MEAGPSGGGHTGADAHAVAVDVRDLAEVRALADAAIEAFIRASVPAGTTARSTL